MLSLLRLNPITTHAHIEQAQYLAILRLDIGLRYWQDIVGSLLPTSSLPEVTLPVTGGPLSSHTHLAITPNTLIVGQCKIYGVIAIKTQGLFLSGITSIRGSENHYYLLNMCVCGYSLTPGAPTPSTNMVPVTPQPFNLVYPNEHDMWAIAILLYLAGTSSQLHNAPIYKRSLYKPSSPLFVDGLKETSEGSQSVMLPPMFSLLAQST
eukprot:sb/3470336/